MHQLELKLKLKLKNLGRFTHVWFPSPVGFEFDPQPTKIQTEPSFRNLVAYFQLSSSHSKIVAKCRLTSQAFSSNPKQFLAPNRFVNSNDPEIRRLAGFLKTPKQCFDWVVGYLEYANPIRGLYSSIQALTDRQVDCGGFSTLLVALLRARQIPARCVFGWAVRSKHGYHAWVEHFDEQINRWISSDPSVAHLGRRTKLDAGFGYINDARLAVSVGEDIKLVGEGITWSTPLLQSPVVVSLNGQQVPSPFTQKLSFVCPKMTPGGKD